MAYHVLIDGAPQGPYEIATIDEMVRAGRIDRETYVWTAGMADWTFADHVPEIAALLRAAPGAPRARAADAEPGEPPPAAAASGSGRLSIRRAFGDAFRVLIEDPIRTVLFAVVCALALVAVHAPAVWTTRPSAGSILPAEGTAWLGLGASFVLICILFGGVCAATLAMVRGEAARIALLFAGARRPLPLIAFGVLALVVTAAGMAALVVPGVFLAVGLALAPLAIVDRRIGPFVAAWDSLRTVRRLGWLRCLGAVLLAVVLLGVAFGGAGFAFEFGWTAVAGGEPEGRVEVVRPVTAGGLLLFAAALAWMFLSGLFASMYVQGRAALDDAGG